VRPVPGAQSANECSDVRWGVNMRVIFAILSLVIAATPALAAPVPVPLIGVGIPSVAVMGAAMLVARLFKRK
jgi:hypothetical protein